MEKSAKKIVFDDFLSNLPNQPCSQSWYEFGGMDYDLMATVTSCRHLLDKPKNGGGKLGNLLNTDEPSPRRDHAVERSSVVSVDRPFMRRRSLEVIVVACKLRNRHDVHP